MALLVAGIASSPAQRMAGVRGVVRNADGVPQMGVVVELLGTNAQVVANAFTDLNGRFLLHSVSPGSYQLRATAALYLPALRNRLQLHAGDLPTINLMLSGLFEQAWPNRTSGRGDLPDDWRWTLRSSANRPLLRVLDDDGSGTSGVRVETGRPKLSSRASVESASGGFGNSGTVASIDLERVGRNESSTSFLRLASTQRGNGPGGVDGAIGLEQHSAQGLVRKTTARVQSRPGIAINGHQSELLVAEAETGERLPLGDLGELQSGALLRTIHLGQATSSASFPFVRLLTTLSPGFELGYNLASCPDFQSVDDIGSARSHAYRFGGLNGGGLRQEQNLHQSISARQHIGRGAITAAFNQDSRANVVLAGIRDAAGNPATAVGADEAQANSVIDPVTGSFLLLHRGFSSQGWFLAIAYPVGENSNIALQGGEDVALGDKRLSSAKPAGDRLGPQRAQFLKVSAQTTVAHTGTRVRAAYAWQPGNVVTVLAPYSSDGDGAFLSIHVRQSLRAGRLFPEGAVFTLDGENLLREGYVAVASTETDAAALAGTLRTLQAGLAFTF